MANTDLILQTPSLEIGLQVTSGNGAWLMGAYKVIDSSIQDDIYIYGLTFQPTNIPTVDSVSEILFEIARGNPEVVFLQFPYSIKADTNANFYLNKEDNWFPEPVFVPAGSMLSVRVARDSPTPSTYQGFKLRYYSRRDVSASTGTSTVTYPENYKRVRSPGGISSSGYGVM